MFKDHSLETSFAIERLDEILESPENIIEADLDKARALLRGDQLIRFNGLVDLIKSGKKWLDENKDINYFNPTFDTLEKRDNIFLNNKTRSSLALLAIGRENGGNIISHYEDYCYQLAGFNKLIEDKRTVSIRDISISTLFGFFNPLEFKKRNHSLSGVSFINGKRSAFVK